MSLALSFGLLSFLSMLIGVYSDCNYFQKLETGVTYYAYNPNYPKDYKGENHCIWKTVSDSPITVYCNIDIPASNNCVNDNLNISSAGSDIKKYCGAGAFTFEGKNVTIGFDSDYYTNGGKFVCEIRSKTKDNCECGWKKETRIVGGQTTGVNEYPMMAGLVDADENRIFCGATIISDKDVLTAAHCLTDADIRRIGVLIGEHDVNTGRETNATKLYRLINCEVHPYYREIYNDIAVCRIDGIIEFNSNIGPACLPFQHAYDTFDTATVTLLGWGLNGFGGSPSNTLQEVNVKVTSLKECETYYNNALENDQICTTSTKGKDSCQSDSGGPVLWEDSNKQHVVLIGIISAGVGCASGTPGINTRVGGYVDWIQSVTPDVQYCMVE